ncbi:MAG TPA: hypothetical protein VLL54_01180, partial [Pyrinomonadaceae bacterium]|nr:hypothetical protein [Pyrinomonadaceae bacterium]
MTKVALKLNQLLLVLVTLFLLASPAWGQTTAARPDRGVNPGGSYAVSDIENINLQNGNVNLSIPLASLPAIAGGKLSFTLRANYNSKLWNVTRSQVEGSALPYRTYVVDTPKISDISDLPNFGGWSIGGAYQIFTRDARMDFDYQVHAPDPNDALAVLEYQQLTQYTWQKMVLLTPDGAEHELRPSGGNYPTYNDPDHRRPYLWGYYRDTPTSTGTPLRYNSSDGTYLSVIINPANHASGISWTIFLPDGTQVIQYAAGFQRIRDNNGNSIKMFRADGVDHYQDEQTGRELRVTGTTQANGYPQTQISYQTVGGIWQHVDVNFGETTVQGKLYRVQDWDPTGQSETGGSGVECVRQQALPQTTLSVVRSIVFPLTDPGEQNPDRRSYKFQYNSDADNTESTSTPNAFFECGGTGATYTRDASVGMGSISRMETPSGAAVDYHYSLDHVHDFIFLEATDRMARDTLTTKALTHDVVDDSAPGGTKLVTDTWSYTIPNESSSSVSSVINPDGSTVTENYFPTDPNFAQVVGTGVEARNGLIFSTSNGVTQTLRHWVAGSQPGTGSMGFTAFNPLVDAEYTKFVGTTLMSARTYQHDANGNVTQVAEYDWFDTSQVTLDEAGVPTGPPAVSPLRVTNTSYYNSAPNTSSGNYYMLRSLSSGTPSILNAAKEIILGPSITRFAYDGQAYGTAPSLGNLTNQSVWDDLDNKWITSSQTYGAYGNLETKTDALSPANITHFFYNDATHAKPTSVVVDPLNGTGTQTISTTYDYSTGQPTSTTDQNYQTTTINYTNQLLSTVDPFGRPGLVISPAVVINGATQQHYITTAYYDSARRVQVSSDLNAGTDGLLKTRTTSDMLGQPVLTEQTEDGTTYTISAKTAYNKMGKVTYSSMPMRSGAAATDSWARATRDTVGRVKEVATFGGAAPPPEEGTNSSWSGNVNTTYDKNFTTVTDQAGKVRRSKTDALGRLVRVDEPDSNGNLGTSSSPNQATSYEYDVLGNLTKVTQGNQPARTFIYDSLSRLRSATNPESGTITYTYDDNGNLITKTDARLVVSHYAYDALNRNTSVTYTVDPANLNSTNSEAANTPTVTRTYDGATNGKGKLWKTETSGAAASRTTINSYDELGRPTSQSQQFKANDTWSLPFTVGVTYGLSGQVLKQTYPSGHTVNYTYDNAGRISSFTGNLGDGVTRTYATAFRYAASGGIEQEKFGTDTALYHKQRYNARGQLWDMRLSTKCFATTPIVDPNCSIAAADGDRGAIVNYYSNNFVQGGSGTDNNGNLLRQEINVPGNGFFQDNFNYDSLNRLTAISEKLNGTGSDTFKQSYSYDRWGNRTIDLGTTNGQPNTTTNVPHPEFTVTTANNRLGVPSGQSGTMTYDAAGNLTADTYSAAAVSRAYDAENRMTSETQANSYDAGTYTYDGDGRRVRRRVGSGETWQSYGLSGELLAEYAKETAASSPQKEYGYRNGQLLITAEAANPRTNVALATNGATASASSTLSGSFAAGGTINGDRKGVNWGNGGGWADASSGTFPDWLEVAFNGSKTIDEIDVFTI